jgi:hypothetical protein
MSVLELLVAGLALMLVVVFFMMLLVNAKLEAILTKIENKPKNETRYPIWNMD